MTAHVNVRNIIAGEVLEIGDMVYLAKDLAYKVHDVRHIPRGIVSKHHEIGDVVDSCIISPGIIGKLRYPDECIGTAGENLIAGSRIEIHTDGKWYNKQ